MWFWFVLLGAASGIQMVFEIAILSMGAFRSWLMESKFDVTEADEDEIEQMKDFVQNLGLGDWFVLYQIGKNTNEEFFHELIKNLSILKAAEAAAAAGEVAIAKADVIDETSTLITVESGDGTELKHRNHTDKPE